ncbi:protein RALF-like 34 [Chenopodium quinoa]|uniref:protein RALF-like 34 n=1 Tax=Chenopodium quinoa TaxID=63459 RepID=UPI000B77BFDF|nr:protein RALF-like 34 [Chenopodium quinoa]
MSSSSSKLLLIFSLLFIISYITLHVEAQIHDIGFDWASSSAMSSAMMYSSGGEELDLDLEVDLDDVDVESRRSLYWKRKVYYISYGALSANRVPCPPRSGRSYYTHNCFAAHGPANPYSRGCSCITRCRR